MKNSITYRDYLPYPFWSMPREKFARYANDLSADQRRILDFFPFKWAFAPPHDPPSALDFLHDNGMGDDGVDIQAVINCFQRMPSFEALQTQGAVEWGGPVRKENPPPGFRMIPEWGPMAGVLLNWPTLYPPLWETFRQMIAACDHVTTYLRIPEGHLGAAVMAWLAAKGLDLDKIQPIPGPVGDSWARDYSPLYGANIYSGEPVAHKFSFAAFFSDYRRQCRHIVKIDEKFAWKQGYRIYRSEILLDGGAILTDGNGTYVVTRRVLKDNHRVPNLRTKLEAWLTAERLIVVDEEPDDLLGHINHFKFINPDTIIVGRPDKPSPVHRYLQNLTRQFERAGYTVIRLPAPEGFDRRMPGGDRTHTALYANSLMINGRLLLATYDHEGLEGYNQAAIESYQEALPDYEIIPIEATIQGNAGGAINCSSKEIPDPAKTTAFMEAN